MRSILFTLSALVLVAASSAFAGPKKKPAAPAKKPSTSSPVAAPTPAFESAAPSSGGGSDGASPQMRGPARIDFDDRLIQGQTNKSGAVYLYDRKELKIRSMIKKRENFREEIVGSLYDT